MNAMSYLLLAQITQTAKITLEAILVCVTTDTARTETYVLMIMNVKLLKILIVITDLEQNVITSQARTNVDVPWDFSVWGHWPILVTPL